MGSPHGTAGSGTPLHTTEVEVAVLLVLVWLAVVTDVVLVVMEVPVPVVLDVSLITTHVPHSTGHVTPRSPEASPAVKAQNGLELAVQILGSSATPLHRPTVSVTLVVVRDDVEDV